MNEYDIVKAFENIEDILITSMKRNLSKHLKDEKLENMNWTMWQSEQLQGLQEFKKSHGELFKGKYNNINNSIDTLLKDKFKKGQLEQEKLILNNIQNNKLTTNSKQYNKNMSIFKGTKSKRIKKKALSNLQNIEPSSNNFFKINQRKLDALIKATTNDFEEAEKSILRYTNDQYRKIIFNAQVYANTGAGTPAQAVDMATKEFFSKGINNIEYSNGNMVNIASYANMAIRTASLRAYAQGEGEKRAEWGIHTVCIPNRGGGCPKCVLCQGRVYIDDVYSGGTDKEAESLSYPLLSTAMEKGFMHPGCKDGITTYFPDITTPLIPPTPEEIEEKKRAYMQQQRLNNAKYQARKYERLKKGSIDKADIDNYSKKQKIWNQYSKELKNNQNGDIIKLDNIDILNISSQVKVQFENYVNNALQYGLGYNKENLIQFNKNTGKEVVTRLYGTNNSVSLTDKAIDKLSKTKANSIISIHNHPSSSSFSTADMNILTTFNSIADMVVVGHDRTIYTLNINGGKRPKYSDINKNYNRIKKETFDYYKEKVSKNEMPASVAWREQSNKINEELAKEYGWKYRRYEESVKQRRNDRI